MERMEPILIPAALAIDRISRQLKYTRAHVAKILRKNARPLGAKLQNRRWYLLENTEGHLRELVKQTSGCRYKLGERGPHE